jgi:hypothetical protein
MAAPDNPTVPAASETFAAVRVFADQALSRATSRTPITKSLTATRSLYKVDAAG